MKFECPVCGAELEHERVDDGVIIHRICKDGVVREIINKSDGFDEVYCSKDYKHKISEDLIEAVLDLVS